MLDCHADHVPKLSEIELLPCSVELPADLEADFQQQGAAPTFPGCRRRFPRFRCRDKSNRIALEHRQSLPGLPRDEAWFSVYLCDLGRGGIGFLHGEPLYPKERLRVLLRDGRVRQIEITRCERLDERCFSVGASFWNGK